MLYAIADVVGVATHVVEMFNLYMYMAALLRGVNKH
jgi:hypothetical protein